MENKHCLNCDTNLTPKQKFCANCGQVASTHRFTIASFFHEGFHAVTHADKGLFYLLKGLTVRPGVVAREFIEGKRKKYFNPFTLFLLLMALFVFVNTFVNSNKGDKRAIPARVAQIKDPIEKQNQLIKYNRAISANDFFKKNGNLIAMLAIPVFAFIFFLVYYRRPYNFSEHLVANLMFISFSNLAFTLIVFPLLAIFKGPLAPLINMIGLLLQAFYFTLAYKGLMQLKGFWPVAKLAFFSVVAITIWAILSVSMIAFYVMRNAHFYEFFKHMGR